MGKPYEQHELDFMRTHAATKTRPEIAYVLKRSLDCIQAKMWELGLHSGPAARRPWTAEELKYLKDNFDPNNRSQSGRRIGKALGRSFNSVMSRLRSDGLWIVTRDYTRWTKKQLGLLTLHVEDHTVDELVEIVGRSRSAIQAKITELQYTPLCGVMKLAQVERETGYADEQLKRARDALGQVWERKGKYVIISERQLASLCEWLKNEGRQAVG